MFFSCEVERKPLGASVGDASRLDGTENNGPILPNGAEQDCCPHTARLPPFILPNLPCSKKVQGRPHAAHATLQVERLSLHKTASAHPKPPQCINRCSYKPRQCVVHHRSTQTKGRWDGSELARTLWAHDATLCGTCIADRAGFVMNPSPPPCVL